MIWIFNIWVFIFSKIESQNINHDLDLFGGAKKLSLKQIRLMKVNFICSKVLVIYLNG